MSALGVLADDAAWAEKRVDRHASADQGLIPAGPHLLDGAYALDPVYVRQRKIGVETPPKKKGVDEVDPGVGNPHDRLAGPRRRCRLLSDLEDIQIAEPVEV